MTAPTPPPEFDGGVLSQLHIALIRLDAKVDGLNSRFGEFSRAHDDHETRLRILETRQVPSMMQFQQLAEREYVEPATVWKVVGLLLTLLGIIVPTILTLVLR